MNYTVGNSKECSIRLELAGLASPFFSLEKITEEYCLLRENGSGTPVFLNGRRIKTARLYRKDSLLLGEHKVETDWLFAEIDRKEKSVRTDFRSEFQELKNIFNEYQTQQKKLNWEYGKKAFIIKMVFALIPMIIGFAFPLTGSARLILVSFSPIIMSLIVLYQQRGSGYSEQKEELSIEFQLKYKCPKCGNKFGFTHWKIIEAEKNCPRCKAILAG